MEENLNAVFNRSRVKIKGKSYPLVFSLKAELRLEGEGVSLLTLPKLMETKPKDTILKLVFAGLPPEQFSGAMDFKEFTDGLDEKEARLIFNITGLILECYFKHLITVLDKQVKEREEKPVKKNFLTRLFS